MKVKPEGRAGKSEKQEQFGSVGGIGGRAAYSKRLDHHWPQAGGDVARIP